MSNHVTITKTEHKNKNWASPDNYRFAQKYETVPLCAGEVAPAMRSIPIAFLFHEGNYILTAILGLQPGENLFISKDGNWMWGHIPSAFRAYPFSSLTTNQGQQLLTFDEDSLSESSSPPTIPFYNDRGELNEQTAQKASFVYDRQISIMKTIDICNAIHSFDLFTPCEIEITRGEKPILINDIYKVDEEKLKTLEGDALAHLQQTSATALIYAHIFSLQNINFLTKLANHRDMENDSLHNTAKDIETFFSDNDDKPIDFSFL